MDGVVEARGSEPVDRQLDRHDGDERVWNAADEPENPVDLR
jgi:hypothetical protein